tara:strand:- start:1652 stop:1936 length:285 start_codon:yes stop_codon:yes gene_type:complete
MTDIDKNSKLFDVDIFDVINETPKEEKFSFENLIESDQKLLRQVIQEEERKERKVEAQQKLLRKEELRKLYKDGKVAKPLPNQNAWMNYESKNK